jgi:hypothetical protein
MFFQRLFNFLKEKIMNRKIWGFALVAGLLAFNTAVAEEEDSAKTEESASETETKPEEEKKDETAKEEGKDETKKTRRKHRKNSASRKKNKVGVQETENLNQAAPVPAPDGGGEATSAEKPAGETPEATEAPAATEEAPAAK